MSETNDRRNPAITAASPYRTGVEHERARVVAWLRLQMQNSVTPGFARLVNAFSSAIERGDHEH